MRTEKISYKKLLGRSVRSMVKHRAEGRRSKWRTGEKDRSSSTLAAPFFAVLPCDHGHSHARVHKGSFYRRLSESRKCCPKSIAPAHLASPSSPSRPFPIPLPSRLLRHPYNFALLPPPHLTRREVVVHLSLPQDRVERLLPSDSDRQLGKNERPVGVVKFCESRTAMSGQCGLSEARLKEDG